MEQMSFFDMFNMSTTPVEEPATKKEEKKAEAKKPAAKKGAKAVEEKKVALPVKVYASAWSEVISVEGKTEAALSELEEQLVSLGYKEVAGANLAIDEDGKVVVGYAYNNLVKGTGFLTFRDGQVTVSSGSFNLEASEEDDFDDKKTFNALIGKWVEQYPAYTDCRLIYSYGEAVAYPVSGKEVEGNVPAGTISYLYNGVVNQMTLDTEADADTVIEKITGVKGGWLYKNEEGIYSAVLKRSPSSKKKGSSSSSSAKPAEVQKFTLPIKVVFTHADDMRLTEEQFPGKTEVTDKELQQYLVNIYEEYTEEKAEFLYFKKDSVVEARIKSAKRG